MKAKHILGLTPDYVTGSEKKFTKHLWVYTPYGYAENKQYDILYLMHGGGESTKPDRAFSGFSMGSMTSIH